MKIVKPQKVLLENLVKTQIEELKDEENIENIENIIISDVTSEKFELYNAKIENTILKNVEILKGKIIKNTFIDVIFEKCNLSNTDFESCCFIRCEFKNCKLSGCNFMESRLYNVSIINTNASYINLALANLENVLFSETILRNSYFQENKLKNVYFEKADLTQAQFTKTSLKDVDLLTSFIAGLAISIENIRGAIIDTYQASDLLYLLGIKIKDNY